MRSLVPLSLALAIVLAACGGSAAPTAQPIGGDIVAPVILDATQTSATVKTGWFIVFNLDDPASWKLSADKPELVELVPGTDDGSMVTNPGAKALKAGDVKITLDNGTEQIVYAITIQ